MRESTVLGFVEKLELNCTWLECVASSSSKLSIRLSSDWMKSLSMWIFCDTMRSFSVIQEASSWHWIKNCWDSRASSSRSFRRDVWSRSWSRLKESKQEFMYQFESANLWHYYAPLHLVLTLSPYPGRPVEFLDSAGDCSWPAALPWPPGPPRSSCDWRCLPPATGDASSLTGPRQGSCRTLKKYLKVRSKKG